jgi:hypothetical protein
MRNYRSLIFGLIALAGRLGLAPKSAPPTLKKVAEFDLPGPPGKRFDYLTITPDDHYLLSAHLAATQIPQHTGLWVGPGEFNFSFRMGATMTNPASPVHELLGWWLIPVCLVIGSLSLAGTTKLIQVLLRRFHWKVPFITTTHGRPAMMEM